MNVTFYLDGSAEHDRAVRALAQGADDNCSILIRDYRKYEPSDIAVVWGTLKRSVPMSWPRGEIMEGQKGHGITVVLDSGYINRGSGPDNYYMVGIGGLNGRADFRNQGMPPDRWAKLNVELKPWRTDGEHILVCGQVPWDASVQNIDIVNWCRDAVAELKKHTKRHIVYRPHPKAITPPIEGAEYSQRPLKDDLRKAWAVVTWNSNSGVDAVIEGIPVFAFDQGSMVLRLANHHLESIENPMMPDRTGWANDIAYAQWTPAEMSSGETWKHLFGGMNG